MSYEDFTTAVNALVAANTDLIDILNTTRTNTIASLTASEDAVNMAHDLFSDASQALLEVRQSILVQGTSGMAISKAHLGKTIQMDFATPNTVVIPKGLPDLEVGSIIRVRRLGAGTTEVVAASDVTVVTALGSLMVPQYKTVTLQKLDDNKWLIEGNV